MAKRNIPLGIPSVPILSALLAALTASPELRAADETVEPLALLQGVENARLQLPPCRIDLTVEYVSEPTIHNTHHLGIIFARDRRRFEQSVGKTTESRSIFDGTQALIFSEGSATLRDMAQATPDYLFDPRMLGITTTYHWDGGVRSSLGYMNATSVALVGKEVIDGKTTWHVSVLDSYKQKLDFWIEPRVGFPVLRHEFSIGHQRNVTTSQYEGADSRGASAVLPRRSKTESFLDGRLADVRTVTVERVEEGISVEPSTWTLAGLEMPRGTPVSDIRTHQRMGYWDGSALVSEPPWPLRPAATAPRKYNNKLLMINLLVLAIVGVLFLWSRRKGVGSRAS